MALEEGTEMGLVLETETVRYFLDGESCGTKERLGALGEGMLDTGAGSHAKRFFDGIGDIPGSETELFGIPVEVVVSLAMLVHQPHKAAGDFFVAGHGGDVLLRKMIQFGFRQIIEERTYQMNSRLAVFVVEHFAHQMEILLQAFHPFRADIPHRMDVDV